MKKRYKIVLFVGVLGVIITSVFYFSLLRWGSPKLTLREAKEISAPNEEPKKPKVFNSQAQKETPTPTPTPTDRSPEESRKEISREVDGLFKKKIRRLARKERYSNRVEKIPKPRASRNVEIGGKENAYEPRHKILPYAHGWQYLYMLDFEKNGYATYSYVLVGRDENNQATAKRFKELIKSIQSSTVQIGTISKHINIASLNIFLIPLKFPYNIPDWKDLSILLHSSYKDDSKLELNYELSKLLINALSIASQLDFSRPGPFIVTLEYPIHFGEPGETKHLLYTDLSKIDIDAFPEIVQVYKTRIIEDHISGIEKLKSLKIALLNMGLTIEDSMGFAQVAVSKLQSFLADDSSGVAHAYTEKKIVPKVQADKPVPPKN